MLYRAPPLRGSDAEQARPPTNISTFTSTATYASDLTFCLRTPRSPGVHRAGHGDLPVPPAGPPGPLHQDGRGRASALPPRPDAPPAPAPSPLNRSEPPSLPPSPLVPQRRCSPPSRTSSAPSSSARGSRASCAAPSAPLVPHPHLLPLISRALPPESLLRLPINPPLPSHPRPHPTAVRVPVGLPRRALPRGALPRPPPAPRPGALVRRRPPGPPGRAEGVRVLGRGARGVPGAASAGPVRAGRGAGGGVMTRGRAMGGVVH